jgi:sulfur-carrier protein adenylyltransferase/sulfurtransferase
MTMDRYIRQTSLPEIGAEGQNRLRNASILMIGAGGLGSAALPYLAAAGIGAITIADHDIIAAHNLHRQTIFRDDQVGLNKATCAADYISALNPDISAFAKTDKLTRLNAAALFSENHFDLILDGTDNFETKSLLNDIAIAVHTPLLSASVNGFSGQIGLFSGHEPTQACYRCVFPDFPLDARNCNESGILGTSAGLTGMLQAHLALGFFLNLDHAPLENFLTLDFKTMRINSIRTTKDNACKYCGAGHIHHHKETPMIEILSLEEIAADNAIILDVRQPEELVADPLRNPLITQTPMHIPLGELPMRMDELPRDRPLALVCAGNIRSVKGANYLAAQGFENVCVLDKFTI